MLALIPVETGGEALEPVVDLVAAADGGQRVLGGGDLEEVAGQQLPVLAAVHREAGGVARGRRQFEAEGDAGGHDDRPEGERVGADGRDDDCGKAATVCVCVCVGGGYRLESDIRGGD